MFHLVLHEPEIPPNTGNAIRLAANTGCRLHLIEPLAFAIDDKRMRRAGLDYHEWAKMQIHADFAHFLASVTPLRLFAFSTRGQRSYADVRYAPGDALVFGSETRGLPDSLLDALPPQQRLYMPMAPGSRSLNLSNTVAVAAFEAWRQIGFSGAAAKEPA